MNREKQPDSSKLAHTQKRKWVRAERKYSNALWHADLHEMTNPGIKGETVIALLDDASRCVTGAFLFQEASSYNAAVALNLTIKRFGKPAAILSGKSKCFLSKMPHEEIEFFNEILQDNKIESINSRPQHSQTTAKLKRWFRTLEDELGHFTSIGDYVDYYNECRLHFSLNMNKGETPREAFRRKTATGEIRKSNPQWMEENSNRPA